MPWDQHFDGKTRGLSMSGDLESCDSSEQKLKDVLTNICPLIDRLGRAFTDLSPHIHRYCQPPTPQTESSPSTAPTNPQSLRHALFPFGPLLSRQRFLIPLLFFHFLQAITLTPCGVILSIPNN